MAHDDEVGTHAVAVCAAIVGGHDGSIAGSENRCADIHLEVVAVVPETRVAIARAICLIHPVLCSDAVWQRVENHHHASNGQPPIPPRFSSVRQVET